MIIYNRKIVEDDLKRNDNIIYYRDNNIAYIIDKRENIGVTKQRVFDGFVMEYRQVKTIRQALKLIK